MKKIPILPKICAKIINSIGIGHIPKLPKEDGHHILNPIGISNIPKLPKEEGHDGPISFT